MKSKYLVIGGVVLGLVGLVSLGLYIDGREGQLTKNNGTTGSISKNTTPTTNKASWKLYADANIGFGFKYPADTKVTKISDKEIKFDFGSETLTLPAIKINQENFPENFITFNKSLTLKTNCDTKSLPTVGNVSEAIFGGANFKKLETGSAVGDVGHDLFIYDLPQTGTNKRCVDFIFDLSHQLDLFAMYKKNPPGDYMSLFEQTTNRGMMALDAFGKDLMGTLEFYDVTGTK